MRARALRLKFVKFQNVTQLSVFIESNQGGEETTKVTKVTLMGQTGDGDKFNVAGECCWVAACLYSVLPCVRECLYAFLRTRVFCVPAANTSSARLVAFECATACSDRNTPRAHPVLAAEIKKVEDGH
jgi:hypothetical protein